MQTYLHFTPHLSFFLWYREPAHTQSCQFHISLLDGILGGQAKARLSHILCTAVAVSCQKCVRLQSTAQAKTLHICSTLGLHSQYCFKIIFLTGTWSDLSLQRAPVYALFPSSYFSCFLPVKVSFFFSFSFPKKPVELLKIYRDLNLKLIRNASVCLLLTYSLITNWWWIHHQCECFVFDACFTCLLLIFGQSITAWSKYSCHCMNFFCTRPCWKGLLIGLWWKWSISNTVFTPDRPSLS